MKLTSFRCYHELLGGHVHMRLFVGGKSELAGTLTMREDEFKDFVIQMPNIEFIPEGSWI